MLMFNNLIALKLWKSILFVDRRRLKKRANHSSLLRQTRNRAALPITHGFTHAFCAVSIPSHYYLFLRCHKVFLATFKNLLSHCRVPAVPDSGEAV